MRDPMVSLPLRISADGQLEHSEPREMLLALFRALAATPAGSWKHAPWFGLQQQFANADLRLEDQESLADAMNQALRELGVTWARVLGVSTAPQQQYGARRFRISLAVEGWKTLHEELSL